MMGKRPEPLVESLREASCRAWKSFSNGSSLLPECRECPSFVLNALLNEARTIGVCQILPMFCQTVQPMISAVCFLLRPPKCHCRASRQMDGRRAAPQCEESGAIRQREKEGGSWCSPFFRHCSANMSKHSKGGRTQNPETVVMAAVKFAVLPPLGG